MGRDVFESSERLALPQPHALSISNEEMNSFKRPMQPAKTVAERESAMFGQGFVFGNGAEIYGHDALIAAKPTEKQAAKAKQEATPVGQPMDLAKFLETRSPISDAFHSGKSHTLNTLIDNAEHRPWTVKAELDNTAVIQEYDAGNSLIRVGTAWTAQRMTENFAHESYHATHQDLDRLFGGSGPVSKQDYLKIKMHQEAGAFLTEVKVNRELGGEPVSYEWADGQNVRHKKLDELIVYKDKAKTVLNESASEAKIADFLSTHHAPIRRQDGVLVRNPWTSELETTPYPARHEKAYDEYARLWKNNHDKLVQSGFLGKGY